MESSTWGAVDIAAIRGRQLKPFGATREAGGRIDQKNDPTWCPCQ